MEDGSGVKGEGSGGKGGGKRGLGTPLSSPTVLVYRQMQN